MKQTFLAASLAAGFALPSNAQISGTFSASLSGFTPTPAYATPLSVGSTSSSVALPTGTVVVVYNTGSNAAYVTLGGASVAATPSDDVIQPNSWMAFTVGTNTYLAAIETAGSTSLNISGGSGLPSGAGGGGGSSGSAASVGSTGSSVPSSGTYAAMNVSGNLTGLTGTANGLKVDGSAVTQPVSGTFWPTTQPVSAASLPLPSGAATAANQEVTIAGTSASSAQAVQGVTGGIAMPVLQSKAANLNATVVGTGTFATQLTGSTNNINNISGTISLPTGAATSANQTNVQSAPGTSQTAAVTVQGNSNGIAVPVSAANLPLPAGAATAANQTVTQGPIGSTVPADAQYVGMNVAGNLTALTGTSNGLKVDGSAVTQPVSAASLPLPIGASSAANQIDVQSAPGTSQTTAITVQGNSSGIALPVSASSLPLPSGAATAANQSNTQGSPTGGAAAPNSDLVGGIYHSSAPTLTNGQQSGLQLDSSGRVIVDCGTGCSGGLGGGSTPDEATFTYGSGNFTPVGGVYNSSIANLASGQSGAIALTAARSMHVVDDNSASLLSAMESAIPAGANTIGKVDFLGNAGGTLDTAAGTAASTLVGTQGGGAAAVPASIIPPTVSSGGLVQGITTAPMTSTASTQVIAAVTSKRIYVTSIHCDNSSGTATLVSIQDGPSGTTLDTLAAGATYGGDNRSGTLPLFWTTAGNGLYAAAVTAGASVICQASGYAL